MALSGASRKWQILLGHFKASSPPGPDLAPYYSWGPQTWGWMKELKAMIFLGETGFMLQCNSRGSLPVSPCCCLARFMAGGSKHRGWRRHFLGSRDPETEVVDSGSLPQSTQVGVPWSAGFRRPAEKRS